MVRFNLIIQTKLLFFLFYFGQVAIAAENYDPLDDTSVLLYEHTQSTPPSSLSHLDVIKSRPLFAISRRPIAKGRGHDSMALLIDGNLKSVELIGVIEASDDHTAGFILEGEKMIWLRRNDYLGEWQVSRIGHDKVELGRRDETMHLHLRKASKEPAH